MTAERWQQIKQLFQEARELPPELRPGFLDQRCQGDPELRSEVGSLLEADQQPDQLIDRPAYAAAAKLIRTDEVSALDASEGPQLVGQTIGAYEFISEIGRGGMGLVYLGRDTRLDRRVAIKMLPAGSATDPDRVRRFQHEARAASLLNHPNIVTILEVAESEGQRFIVSEFIEGKTLRQIMKSGALKLIEALDVAIQTASALSAAHDAGIVHRDIKPENIMVRPDGYVKVLDFGLAKLTEQAGVPPSGQGEEETTTLFELTTRTGVVMGTVMYMSPEQAQGQKVDGRTDIFSLGVVLYETITGRAPFQGETPSHTIVAILESQPPPIGEYVPDARPELQMTVDKALRKKSEERYQTMREMLDDLREVREEAALRARQGRRSGPESGAKASAPAGETRTGKLSRAGNAAWIGPKLIGGAIVAALVAFGLLYLLIGMKHPRSGLGGVFQNRVITRLTSSGQASNACISPDGKYVAYVLSDQGQKSIRLKQLATQSDVQVVAPSDTDYPGMTFSPDGNYIYYTTREKGTPARARTPTTLYQVASLGGSPRKVMEKLYLAISLSPDGKSFSFLRRDSPEGTSALWVARADGTGERKLAERDFGNLLNLFTGTSWSPDGKVIACYVVSDSGGFHFEITTVPAGGGPEKSLSTKDWNAITGMQWLADGTGLLISANQAGLGPYRLQIWRVSYPEGQVQRVTSDLSSYNGISMTADSSSLVTVEQKTVSNIWTVPVSPGGTARQLTSGSGRYSQVSCARDGRIAYCSDLVGGREDIGIMDSEGKNRRQLTDAGINDLPTVSQDLRRIVFDSSREPGYANMWAIDVDGGNPKQLTTGVQDYFPALSPDGKWLYYTNSRNGTTRVWRAPADGGNGAPLIDLSTMISEVSPDGKLLACVYLQDATHSAIGIFRADEGSLIQTIPTQRGMGGGAGIVWGGWFRWARDGKSIVYIQNTAGVSNLWQQALSGGPPTQMTNFTSDQIFDFDITFDGKQFVCSRGNVTSDVILMKDTGNP